MRLLKDIDWDIFRIIIIQPIYYVGTKRLSISTSTSTILESQLKWYFVCACQHSVDGFGGRLAVADMRKDSWLWVICLSPLTNMTTTINIINLHYYSPTNETVSFIPHLRDGTAGTTSSTTTSGSFILLLSALSVILLCSVCVLGYLLCSYQNLY